MQINCEIDPNQSIDRKPAAIKALSAVIGLLSVYLFFRYTPITQVFAPDKVIDAGGISAGYTLPLLLIGAFAGCCIGLVHINRVHGLITDLLKSPKKIYTLACALLVIAGIVISIGKATYSPYTDELRDVSVANLVAEYSLQLYLYNERVEEITDNDERNHLEWAQGFHPPGHYIPAVFLDRKHSTVFYRYIYFLPLAFFAWVTLYLARALSIPVHNYIALFSLLLSFTFLRNYTFIRFGNELFPFLGFSGFLIIIYLVYTGKVRFSAWVGILGLLCFMVAIFAKTTAFVAMLALMAALFVGVLIWKEKRLMLLLLYCFAVLTGSFVVYFFALENSVIGPRIQGYAWMIRQTVESASEEILALDPQSEKVQFIPAYFFTFPFKYGPIIILAIGYSIYGVLTRRLRVENVEVLTLLFILFGLFGVALVGARAQYTAPLMLGLAFLIGRYMIKAFPPALLLKVSLIAVAFAMVEVLLVSTA